MNVLQERMKTSSVLDGIRLLVVARPGASAYARELRQAGYSLRFADSLGDAVRAVVADPPDAILILTDAASAVSMSEVLGALGPQPLLVAADALSTDMATACLDAGADAAISLPITPAELVARLQALWRRAARERQNAAPQRIAVRDLVIDLNAHTVLCRGQRINLSPTEFQLLSVLARNVGRVVSSRDLLISIWSEQYADDVHYVRLYIGYLRSKLEDDPRHPQLILTHWGVGYRLAVDPGDSALPFER